MPSPDLDQFIADALTAHNHLDVAEVVADPSGRPDAWCRVKVVFSDGSAAYIGVEAAR
ncbi:MAG: hypothetical protein KDB70_04085 [Mycobacterium sp.]|nr:hypothetical protein [Mycobacterium sp.]